MSESVRSLQRKKIVSGRGQRASMHSRAYAHDKRTKIKDGTEHGAEPRVPPPSVREVTYRAPHRVVHGGKLRVSGGVRLRSRGRSFGTQGGSKSRTVCHRRKEESRSRTIAKLVESEILHHSTNLNGGCADGRLRRLPVDDVVAVIPVIGVAFDLAEGIGVAEQPVPTVVGKGQQIAFCPEN